MIDDPLNAGTRPEMGAGQTHLAPENAQSRGPDQKGVAHLLTVACAARWLVASWSEHLQAAAPAHRIPPSRLLGPIEVVPMCQLMIGQPASQKGPGAAVDRAKGRARADQSERMPQPTRFLGLLTAT